MARRRRARRETGTLALEIGVGMALLVGVIAGLVLSDPRRVATLAIVAGSGGASLVLARRGLAELGAVGRRLRRAGRRLPRQRAPGLLVGALLAGVSNLLWTLAPGLTPERPGGVTVALFLVGLALWLLRPLLGWVVPRVVAALAPLLGRAGRLASGSREVPATRRWGWTTRPTRREDLLRLSPRAFEELCARLLQLWGYRTRVVGESGDGGIDIEMWRDGGYAVAQCKRYRGTVGVAQVRDFFGAMIHVGADRGYFFTTGRFTQAGEAFVEGKPIELLDGARLERLLARLERPAGKGPRMPAGQPEGRGAPADPRDPPPA